MYMPRFHTETNVDVTIVKRYLQRYLLEGITSVTLHKNPKIHLLSKNSKVNYFLDPLLIELDEGTHENVINFLWDMNHTMFVNLGIFPLFRDKNTMYSLLDLIHILTGKCLN